MKRLLLLLMFPVLLLAQPSPEKVSRIQQLVTTEMARASMPGVSVAVATSGWNWTQGFGMADLENLVPVTPQTRIRLGSISKPITAVAVMQLVEQGKIDLDGEVQRYLPSFPRKQWPITIRELLGHQSGIRHYRADGSDLDSVAHYTNRIEPLKIFAGDPLLFEPGTKYSYTTYGFNLLGAIVETLSGQLFNDYVRAHIFEPAGMDGIGPDDAYVIVPHRARGYALVNGALQNCHLADTSNKIPGGGLSSTAADLVKFAMGVNAGVLVKDQDVRLMFTPQKLRDGTPTRYGMGFEISEVEGRRMVSHGGGQQGITTMLELFPEEKVAVSVMSNLEHAAGVGPIARGVAKIVLATLP